jgi:hypothetical protein
MSTEILDGIMRRILNDQDVFAPPFDKYMKTQIILFRKEEWRRLGEAFKKKDRTVFDSLIDERLQNLRNDAFRSQEWRRKEIEKLLTLGESFKNAFATKPNLLSLLFSQFDTFALFECRLPNMEDFGKVIENHAKPIVDEFFLHQIDKADSKKKVALKRIFECVNELYNLNIDVIEIAFFVRKLNSLKELVEVIQNE